MVDSEEIISHKIQDALSIATAGERVAGIARLLNFSRTSQSCLGMLTRDFLLNSLQTSPTIALLQINLTKEQGRSYLLISIKPKSSTRGLRHSNSYSIGRIQICSSGNITNIKCLLPNPDFTPNDTWLIETRRIMAQPHPNELKAEIIKKNIELQSLLREVSRQKADQKLKNQKLEEAYRQLEIMRDREYKLARIDRITGLASRTFFDERLRLLPEKNANFTLFYLDLDRFKEVNDTLGHTAGDIVLRVIGERIRDSVRDEDTVARIGGDEFAILLPNIHTVTHIESLAERLISRISEKIVALGEECSVGVSIGVAINDTEQIFDHSLIERADSAMYAAKRAGGGCFHIFSSKQH